MDKKGVVMPVVVVCAVVSILGLITVIFGVAGVSSAAESFVEDGEGGCEYRSTPAAGCGIVAMLFALTTQIVATAATGCCACCRTFETTTIGKRITIVVLSTVSWVLAIIVVILFIVGALGTIDASEGIVVPPNGACDSPAVKVFAAATVLFLIAAVLQIISYILFQTMAPKSLPQEQSGIPLGQPPVPPNSSAPTAPVEAGASAPLPPTVSFEGSADPTSQV